MRVPWNVRTAGFLVLLLRCFFCEYEQHNRDKCENAKLEKN